MRCQPPRAAAAASQPAAVTFKATSQRRQVAAQAGHSTRRTRYSCPARSGSLPTAELDQRMAEEHLQAGGDPYLLTLNTVEELPITAEQVPAPAPTVALST